MLKTRQLFFIIFNVFLINLTVFQWDYFYLRENLTHITFALILFIIGIFVYLISVPQKTTNLFLLIMFIVGWIIILLQNNHLVFQLLSRILMCIVPILFFDFFANINHLHKRPLYYKFFKVLLFSGVLTAAALLSYIRALQSTFFIYLIITTLACATLSYVYRDKQRNFFRKYQKVLILAIIFSFLPFILAHTFVRPIISEDLVAFSIYTFMALPITISYILIKQDQIKLSIDFRLLKKKLIFYILSFILFITICLKIFNWTLPNLTLITLLIFSFILARDFFFHQFDKQEIQLINQSKANLDKEKIEILQKITYDNYLSSLSNLIQQLIFQKIQKKDLMIIWREGSHYYIFEQRGVFENFSLKPEYLTQLKDTFDAINIQGVDYPLFPLTYRNIDYGWLILENKKFSPSEIREINQLAESIGEIIKLSEVLHNNQSRYIRLKNVSYDDYLQLQILNNNENFRKKLAYYLHDDLLQTILATKNLMHLIETEQEEIKNLILHTMEEINTSLREKMFDLYPSTLDHLGLYQSLTLLCDKLKTLAKNQSHLKIHLNASHSLEVPPNLRYPVYRIIKELLQNAIKHAKANNITITITPENSGLFISVRDDGIGFDWVPDLEQGKYNNNLGLLSIKQEINALNGNLSIKSKKIQGTSVQIIIPI